jgi:putative acetyltransferase
VDALRARGALALSLVAEHEGRVVGHIAFSPATADGQPSRWFALGPVSVEPSLHKLGLGAQLIDTGLHVLRERGAAGCVLIGDPAYYARFGFVLRPEMAPPGQPNEIFQVRHLGASPREAPVIDFHPVFRDTPDPGSAIR